MAILALLLLPAGLSAQRGGRLANVTIKDSRYTPASIKIKAGETVVWTNKDDRDHTVVAADGSFASGPIKPEKTYQYTFRKAGKYSYACRLHPRMKGTVEVE